jgi:hypothetical protein
MRIYRRIRLNKSFGDILKLTILYVNNQVCYKPQNSLVIWFTTKEIPVDQSPDRKLMTISAVAYCIPVKALAITKYS